MVGTGLIPACLKSASASATRSRAARNSWFRSSAVLTTSSAIDPPTLCCAGDGRQKDTTNTEATMHRFKRIGSPFLLFRFLAYRYWKTRREEGGKRQLVLGRRRPVMLLSQQPEWVVQGSVPVARQR